jgi:exonuclease SbcC
VVDVAHELDEILQLSQEQFLQVILLAQNRFADFLLADSKERQTLLRRLFGTERFSDYQARFDERRRAAENTLSSRRAKVDAKLDEAERLTGEAELWGEDADAAPDTTDARIERLRRAIARADYQVERFGAERVAAEKALGAADAALTDLKEQQQGQVDRDRARAALAELDAQTEEIAAAAARRDRGRAADGLRTLITVASRTLAAAEAAARTEMDAVDAASAAGMPSPADFLAASPSSRPGSPNPSKNRASSRADDHDLVTRYRTWAADRTRESGAWQRAAELEASAPERSRELARSLETERALTAALQTIDLERDTLPERLTKLAARRDTARTEGAVADSAARAVVDAEARAAGVLDVERLTAELAAAALAESEASDAHTRAQADLSELRRRRLDGYAGELAEALVTGEPCAVCGSVEHPSPAEHVDPVTAEDIAAAEAVRDAAANAERKASRTRSVTQAALAAATERAGGLTAEQAAEELAQARAAHEAALQAADRAHALTIELDALRQDAADVEARRATAADSLGAARTALSLIQQRIADAEQAIAEARGDYPTVAERASEAQRQIAAATAVADAIDARAEAAERARLARIERDRAIDVSDFDDVTAAEQSLLPASEIQALDERVTAHQVARDKERALLLDLELRVLPEDPIDLAPAQESAATARAVWLKAVDDDSRARAVQSTLTSTAEAAASEHSASAAEAEEFEVLRGLADTLAGRSGNTHKMNLETFVLAAELEEIVAAANLRLREMSAGRYELQHSDALAARGKASGLGIVVFDAFTGQSRPARSLSGGETFLSSLALALGLAEVVTSRAGGIQLDTLFIDEGFGSLDADTLETAMRTLDELRQGGRTVGVISHVEAMQEQIPAQLTVRALPDGPSVIDAPLG